MAKTKRRKKRTHVAQTRDPAKKADPRSFVFWRGKHGLILKALEGDLRKVMQPNTAEHLRESRKNQLRDFVDIAGPLGVSHFLMLTATDNAAYLRVAKTPRGPTLTMRIHEYSLMRDVLASVSRPRQPASMWAAPPLVVMNNFANNKEELRLATALFQGLFPAINVQTVKLSSCQRVVLLSYEAGSNRIAFRHYGIAAQPSGVSRGVKTLVSKRQLPDMGGLADVAELLTKGGYGSESEGEEAAEARVALPQDMGRGNLAQRQSRVRLQEIGPRMELEIVKVEEGLCAGRVLFHAHRSVSAEDADAQQAAIDERDRLRAERRREQAENVAKKAGLKKRKAVAAAAAPEGAAKPGEGGEGGPAQKRVRKKREWWEEELDAATGRQRVYEPDDDAAYYREEVGEEPEDMPGLSAQAVRQQRLQQRQQQGDGGGGGDGMRGRGDARGRGSRGKASGMHRGESSRGRGGARPGRGRGGGLEGEGRGRGGGGMGRGRGRGLGRGRGRGRGRK